MDFAAAGLLEGLEGEERAARLELLERLAADGVGVDELRAAVAEDRLALLPLDRVLGARYSAAEIERDAGLPAELLIRFRRLLGLPTSDPDERVFAEEDIDAARSTQLFLDSGLEMEAIVAVRFSLLAEQLTPAVKPVLAAAYGQHLRESVGRGMIGREERITGRPTGGQEVTICFADLVGFTRLGGEVEVQELGSVAGALARLAAEAAQPPVRLVKTIGDAAMFVSPETEPLVGVALALVEAAEQAELPSLRAGVASGPALLRSGDFYGHSVNLASRVTGIARPGSVLCTQEVHDAAPDAFEWSFAGRHRLKGVAEPAPLHRARPLRSEEDAPDEGATKPRSGRRRRRESS
jgi:adenylate cyclase